MNKTGNSDNHILSETLSIMKSVDEQISLSDWLLYLTGETWNPMRLNLQIRRVRDRLSKTLSEKGVLTPRQEDYILFNVTTYPLLNNQIKMFLFTRIKDILINKWSDKLYLKDLRSFCLAVLLYTANVVNNALYSASGDEYMRGCDTILKISGLDLNDTIRSLLCESHKIFKTESSGVSAKRVEFAMAVLQVLMNSL